MQYSANPRRGLKGVLPYNEVADFPLLFEEGRLRDQEKSCAASLAAQTGMSGANASAIARSQ
jgi:hypothetical protein